MAETETKPPVICAACVELLREIEQQIVATRDPLETLALVRAKIVEFSPPKTATVPIPLPPA
ncbi:MAG: hypothetical protein JWO89_3727 [Verrucomicrobiaceae bacterium]|nr:hypothetical protein [Verrucomicrobiaceae bacterium]